jgi:hypothetical protein
MLVKEASKLDKAISPSFDLHMFDTATRSRIAKRIDKNMLSPRKALSGWLYPY